MNSLVHLQPYVYFSFSIKNNQNPLSLQQTLPAKVVKIGILRKIVEGR